MALYVDVQYVLPRRSPRIRQRALQSHSGSEKSLKSIEKRIHKKKDRSPQCNSLPVAIDDVIPKPNLVELYKKTPKKIEETFRDVNGRNFIKIKWQDDSSDWVQSEHLTSEMKKLLHAHITELQNILSNTAEETAGCINSEVPETSKNLQSNRNSSTSTSYIIHDNNVKTLTLSINAYKQKQKQCLKDTNLLRDLGIENANVDIKIII